MSKFGVVVASRDHESLRFHLSGHLRFTEMWNISYLVVPAGSDESRARIEDVVREFRGWSPPGQAREVRLVSHAGPAFEGNLRHAGAQVAAREHGCDVLVFAAESTVVGPGWRHVLEKDLEHGRRLGDGRVGLVGARSNCVRGPQSVFHPGTFPASTRRKEWQKAMQDPRAADPPPEDADAGEAASVSFPWPRIATHFAAVPAEAYFDAGGFDQDLPADGASDDTLCVRLLRKGYHNFVSRLFVPNFPAPRGAPAPGTADPLPADDEDLRRGSAWFRDHYPDREEVVRRELQWTGAAAEGPGGAVRTAPDTIRGCAPSP